MVSDFTVQTVSNNSTITEKGSNLSQLRGKALWAALATLVDGEGCICIQKGLREGGVTQYSPVISVVNTNVAWLNAWRNRVERGAVRGFIPANGNWKARATWQISKKADVVYILKRILPYLFCKVEQAVTVINFIEDKVVVPFGVRAWTKPSEEELLRRESAYLKMRKLNAKGNPERLYVEQPLEVGDIVQPIEPSIEQGANDLA